MINITKLSQQAEEFEEAVPNTLPSGYSLFPESKPVIIDEIEPTRTRATIQHEITAKEVKSAIEQLGNIMFYCKNAASVLKSMSRDAIFDQDTGIDVWLEPLNELVNKVNETLGRKD
jgi:hypothetical protein